jgi:NitT/TauT family transport system permease protein
VLRIVSLLLFLGVWLAASMMAGARLVPAPQQVGLAFLEELMSGAMLANMGATLLRVAASFTLAMALGVAIGIAMGRSRKVDRLFDPWLLILLNMPALVVIVLAFIWGGLTETAGILAVAINKLPNTVVTIREGARAMDRGLKDMADVFQIPRLARLRHVVLPQLAPYIAAGSRSGLSLIWKIVLVVELLGRPNGVGFEIGSAFQLFDVTRILAYSFAFVLVMLTIEMSLVQPIERRIARWRPRQS